MIGPRGAVAALLGAAGAGCALGLIAGWVYLALKTSNLQPAWQLLHAVLPTAMYLGAAVGIGAAAVRGVAAALRGRRAAPVAAPAALWLAATFVLARLAPVPGGGDMAQGLAWFAAGLLAAGGIVLGPIAARAARRPRAALPWLTLGILVAGGAEISARLQFAGPFGDPAAPNLVLVVVDCLRADHTEPGGYQRPTSPGLASLARQGRWYERAYSAGSWTKPSVGAIVTGQAADVHGAAWPASSLRPELRTVAERLQAQGYFTLYGLGGNLWIGSEFGFTRGYDYVLEGSRRSAEELNRWLLGVIARQKDRPFFVHFHYMDVHVPYVHDDFSATFGVGAPPHPGLRPDEVGPYWVRRQTAAGLLTDRERNYLIDLYDAQIRYVDAQIGGLVQAVQRLETERPTWFLITSDHGEEFWEHGNYEHGHTLYDELLHVPLLLVGPGLEPARVTEPVHLTDVAPTLLDLAGDDEGVTELPGHSLLRPRPSARLLVAVNSLYGSFGLASVQGRLKTWLQRSDQRLGMALVGSGMHGDGGWFDLDVDPDERQTHALPPPPAVRSAHRELAAIAAALTRPVDRAAAVDPSLAVRLRALGYVQ